MRRSSSGLMSRRSARTSIVALRRPHRLHRAVAAVGAVGRQVRVDRQRVDPHVRDPVRADAGVAELRRDAGPAVGVGARVDPAVDLLGHERAVVLGADPHADRRRVAVERDELLGAVEDDLHRPLAPCAPARRRAPRCARRSWPRTTRPSAARRCARRRSSRPNRPARSARVLNGVCVPAHTVRRPSSHSARAACGSIGTCAALGVRNASSTITSASREPGGDVAAHEPEAMADVRPGSGRTPIETASSAESAALRMQQRGAGRDRLDGVEDGRQLLVLDLDAARRRRAPASRVGAAIAATTSPA